MAYLPHNLPNSALQFMMQAGAGVKGSAVIIDNSNPFEGSKTNYVYAIQVYTAEGKFDALKEMGKNVTANRLDAGGSGYPEMAVIPGRFTYIKPDASTVVTGFVIKTA